MRRWEGDGRGGSHQRLAETTLTSSEVVGLPDVELLFPVTNNKVAQGI